MNMHDQFLGMNTIQQPFLSCLPAFYALAIPMSSYTFQMFFITCSNESTEGAEPSAQHECEI